MGTDRTAAISTALESANSFTMNAFSSYTNTISLNSILNTNINNETATTNTSISAAFNIFTIINIK